MTSSRDCCGPNEDVDTRARAELLPPGTTIPTTPNIVFDVAARAGLGIDLETACLHASIEASRRLPPNGYLSLNASPELV
jgi:hypothetical protein